mmetsp:Transcript_15622/g.20045  ORF Transcript_15622/g.20045 Transcript_15622/m.20045 type:complete len:636 (-) Transcript_15622:662-2569(-)
MAAKVASHPFHDGFPTSTAAQDRSQNKHNNVDVEEKHNESNTYNEMEIDGEKNERIEAAERQKLKKTCEDCSKSKLKCSGEYPTCYRCKQRGRECVYLQRKKRVNKPKNHPNRKDDSGQTLDLAEYVYGPELDCAIKNESKKRSCIDGEGCVHGRPQCTRECVEHLIQLNQFMLFPPLESNETALSSFYGTDALPWSTLSALVKTYANDFKFGHVTILLRRELRTFQTAMRRANSPYGRQTLKRLEPLLASEDIDLDKGQMLAKRFISLKFPNRKQIDYNEFKRFSMFMNAETEMETGKLLLQDDDAQLLQTKGTCVCQGSCEMLQSGRAIITEMKDTVLSRTPMLRLRCDYYLQQDDDPDYVKVQCNDAFRQIFGFSNHELEQRLRNTVSGYLPFGSNILSHLVSKESDLLAYLQVMCVKNSTEHPTDLPWYSEIPSAQCFELNVRKSPFETATTAVPCMVQSVFRRYLDERATYSEMYLLIKPLQPLDHLFEPFTTFLGTDQRCGEEYQLPACTELDSGVAKRVVKEEDNTRENLNECPERSNGLYENTHTPKKFKVSSSTCEYETEEDKPFLSDVSGAAVMEMNMNIDGTSQQINPNPIDFDETFFFGQDIEDFLRESSTSGSLSVDSFFKT